MTKSRTKPRLGSLDRKSTRLNSSHTVIYTLSLHDALPISGNRIAAEGGKNLPPLDWKVLKLNDEVPDQAAVGFVRSEEHTSELQSHRDLHSFPTRRSSDLRQPHRGRRWQKSPPT